MIYRIIKNSALNTKVLSMKHFGLSLKEYEIMLRLSSVSEVAAFLKNNTKYKSVLKDTDTSTIHRGHLESLLNNQLNFDIKSILSFSHLSTKFFLKVFLVEEEINEIKIFLRYLFTEDINSYKNFKSKVLTNTENINNFKELATALENTKYYSVLKPFIDQPEKQNLFEIEMAFDRFYNNYRYKCIKKYLSPNDAKIASKSFGILADLETIMFIIRSKKYYNFSEEQIYSYINIHFHHLKNKDIKAMVSAKAQKDIVAVLQNTPYKNIFSENLSFFEKNVHKYILRVNGNLYRKNSYSIQSILNYIIYKKIEIKNIITIIEGIRYGLKPEEISKHLILLKIPEQEGTR